MVGVAPHAKPPEADRAHHHRHPARDAEELGQTGPAVWGLPSKHIVVDGRDTGRRKAEQEAIEGQMVRPAARLSPSVVLVVAAFAVPAVQILQAQGGMRAFGRRRAPQIRAPRRRFDRPPETRQTQAERKHRKQEYRQKHRHHQIVRKDRVKTALRHSAPETALPNCGQHQKERQAECKRQRNHQTVPTIQATQCRRPCVIGVGLAA